MLRRLLLVGSAVSLLVVAFAVLIPASAETPQETIARAREEREAARAARAAEASELQGLQASEDDLEAALAALDDQIATQEAKIASAEAAIALAEVEAIAFRDRLAIAAAERDRITDQAAQRAIEAFTRPSNTELANLFDTDDVYEAARRTAVLEALSQSDGDADEDLRAIEIELLELEAGSLDAAERVARWEQELASALASLADARATEQRLLDDLQLRINDVQAEIDRLEAAEADLNAAISSAEAEIAAEEARRARLAEEAARAAAGSSSSSGSATAPSGNGQLGWPASGTLTSGFGQRWGRLHAGIDIAAPTGTPIFAADSGVVTVSGSMGGYGKVILVDHGNGIVTLYAHLSERLVSVGDSVGRGGQIGRMGNTGNSTGPHLHFEVRVNGSPVNPLSYL